MPGEWRDESFPLQLGLLALGTSATLLRAEEIACPASVTTRQSAAEIPAGWTAGRVEMPSTFTSVTFYSGPPEVRASLAPDRTVKHGGLLTLTWRFGRGERIWVSCGYGSTTVTLSRVLPERASGCTVLYEERAGGLPGVRKIDCR